VSTGPGQECLIVDPGQDSARAVADTVAEHGLAPVAVLVTHGHLDHTWSVVPVCRDHRTPAWIHTADRERLANPLDFVGDQMRAHVQALTAGTLDFAEPEDVRELSDHQVLELAGLTLTVRHTPGHTPGSVVFHVQDEEPFLLSGDVLFNQGIGRTDLPGGDLEAMRRSLREVVMTFADETPVLPGHGPTTTIGAERATSPYLHELIGRPA
jgi:hydroxyacylglutathione hydrolase